jgi:tRNA A37 N6-isopentenylltransferase MiaA
VRERYNKGELSKEDLLRMLKEVDPESARQIPHGSATRLMRALEVYYGTGKTRSEIVKRRVEGQAGSL